MQTEIDELAEPAAAGKGGSSTMPHKRNPVGCAAVLTAATRAPGLVATVFAGMVQEHERALGGWQAEWDALPDLARLAGGALAQHRADRRGHRRSNVPRLAANLDVTHGLILGEAVMLALGDSIGRLDAHHLVERASKAAIRDGHTLFDVLAADPAVTAHLSARAPEATARSGSIRRPGARLCGRRAGTSHHALAARPFQGVTGMPYAAVNGTELHYRIDGDRHGSAPWLVLVEFARHRSVDVDAASRGAVANTFACCATTRAATAIRKRRKGRTRSNN